ncbi:MAG TPA: S8 family serine peptidase [Vicinamibacterales bacterium]|nr:S8 family serine peptidase [Vicinamibacterales bacterium]
MARSVRFLTLVAVGISVIAPRGQAPPLPFPLLTSTVEIQRLAAAWNSDLPYVPGEVLVKFKSGAFGRAESRALSVLRGSVDNSATRWAGDALIVATPDEPDAALAADRLAAQPEVEWAQPNYLRSIHATPNDPSFPRQWNFELIDLPRAWDINPGGSADVVIAVIDTGVTTVSTTYELPLWTGSAIEGVPVPFAASPDVSAGRMLPGRDFVFWSGPPVDMVGHGTHVAGTALEETNNGLGLAGIAYRSRLMPLKACYGYWEIQIAQSAAGVPGYVDPRETGTCPDSAVSEAIRYAADNGAQVINLSLGGPAESPITREALQYAVNHGVFVAISNGNDAQRGNPVQYPAAYAPAFNGVVSVGAVGANGTRAPYSSTGAHLELSAPGGDVTLGAAAAIFQVGLISSDFNAVTVIRPRFERYAEVAMQGTSMATPHVAGLGALLYSQGVHSPAGIESALRKTARDVGAPGRDDEYGDGLIDARAALRGLGLAR